MYEFYRCCGKQSALLSSTLKAESMHGSVHPFTCVLTTFEYEEASSASLHRKQNPIKEGM